MKNLLFTLLANILMLISIDTNGQNETPFTRLFFEINTTADAAIYQGFHAEQFNNLDRDDPLPIGGQIYCTDNYLKQNTHETDLFVYDAFSAQQWTIYTGYDQVYEIQIFPLNNQTSEVLINLDINDGYLNWNIDRDNISFTQNLGQKPLIYIP